MSALDVVDDLVRRLKEHRAALLWLRNHYDADHGDPALRERVIRRIDGILATGDPVIASDMAEFRAGDST